jgi:hypothetical protein
MSTAADKLLLAGIENGILTKELFKTHAYSKAFTGLAKISAPGEFSQLISQSGGDAINALGNLSEQAKIGILRALAKHNMLEEQPAFWGIIPHIFRPDSTPVKGVSMLEKDKETPFKVDIPIDTLSTFMGEQYLEIEFFPPQLSKATVNDQYRGLEKYTYTDKPGIRLFSELKFTSNANTAQQYNYLDVLRIDKEEIKTSFYEQWNRCIGNDLYQTAAVYNQATEITYGVLTRTGYQTPKHEQQGLKLRVPLFFNHNQCFLDKFNLNSFLEGTLTIEGSLVSSDKMVKAEFYPDDVTLPVVQLDCDKLKVKNFSLTSNKFFVDDQYHALMSNKQISKFVRYVGNTIGTIKDNDPENKIPVKGKGYVENLTFCLRPASYENDFVKWQYLSEVSQQCSPTVIVVKDNLGDFKKLAVKPASIQIPTSPLELLGMIAEKEYVKPMRDPEYYSNLEAMRNAKQSSCYYPRDNVLYKFAFNYHYKQKLLSGMFVQTKIPDALIDYKFKDDYVEYSGLLKQKWQYIIFRDLCNQQFAVGSSVTSMYQL